MILIFSLCKLKRNHKPLLSQIVQLPYCCCHWWLNSLSQPL